MVRTPMVDNPFLRDLTPEQFDLLSALFERMELPARASICRQGEPAIHMYFLQEGNVSIRYKPYDGPRITLTHLGPGDVFGWSAVVGNFAYTSDATATTAVCALRVRGMALRNLCVQYPAAGTQILEKLADVVSPRWIDARRQVQGILRREILARA
jgi:CRP/FNR family cyclic AMP-dependent transcriptional regulator